MSLTQDIRRLESALRKKGFTDYRFAVRSARIARDEVAKLAKQGVDINMDAVKKLISNPKRLLQYKYDDAGIRELIRSWGMIKIGTDLSTGKDILINYQKHLKAKEAVERYNKSVDMWNIMHRAEIEAGDVNKRYHKRFSVGESPKETQATAEAWYKTVLTAYSKPSAYYEGRLAFYIQKVNQAMDNFVPVGMDFFYDFFNAKLATLDPSGDDYYQIKEYYHNSRTDRFSALQKMAEHYGWGNEYRQMIKEHQEEIDNYKMWM